MFNRVGTPIPISEANRAFIANFPTKQWSSTEVPSGWQKATMYADAGRFTQAVYDENARLREYLLLLQRWWEIRTRAWDLSQKIFDSNIPESRHPQRAEQDALHKIRFNYVVGAWREATKNHYPVPFELLEEHNDWVDDLPQTPNLSNILPSSRQSASATLWRQ